MAFSSWSVSIDMCSTENSFEFRRFFRSASRSVFDTVSTGRMLMIATRAKSLNFVHST